MITAELLAKKKPSDRHWYAYDVLIDGETIVSNSRDPEHDLARALLARGSKGVVKVIDGKTGKSRSRVNIQKAARWSVGSNLESYKWKPPEAADSSPHRGETPSRALTCPPSEIGPTSAVFGGGFPQDSCPAAKTRGPRSEVT